MYCIKVDIPNSLFEIDDIIERTVYKENIIIVVALELQRVNFVEGI